MATRTNDGRPTVAILVSYAPSLILFRGPLMAELLERGYDVYALAPDIASERPQLEAMGVHAVDVQLVNSSMNPLAALRTTRRLARILREIAPELVLAYTIKPIVLGAPAARAAKVPKFVAVITGLGYAFTPGREAKRLVSRAAAMLLYRRAFRFADLAVFLNSDDRDHFRKLRLLPRSLSTAILDGEGVDTDFYAPAPLPTGVSFLMIARLLRDKGIREYGEATRLLKRKWPEIRVSLVGGGFNSPDCLTEAELRQVIDAGVEWLGPTDDVRPALAASSVYVLPSYREGIPRSVLEAFSVGRPVITTDVPGCRQTVTDGVDGLVVPPRDSKALYAAMARLVEHPALIAPMAEKARTTAVERFGVRKINEELLRLVGL